MGRNKTPTPILEARGSFIQNPSRVRKNEPKPNGTLGSPPKYLSPEQKKIWKEIAKRLAPGVTAASDRDAFEMMVRLTQQMRNEDETHVFPTTSRNTLISLWSRFAMTPRRPQPCGCGQACRIFVRRLHAPQA